MHSIALHATPDALHCSGYNRAASFAFAPIIVITAQNAASPSMLALVIASLLILAGIFFYALIDAGLLARKTGPAYQVKEYNRWYIYLIFIVVAVSVPQRCKSVSRLLLLWWCLV